MTGDYEAGLRRPEDIDPGTYLGLWYCRSGIHAWGRQSWIAIIESGAVSAVRFSRARKAWAKEWSTPIRVSWNPCARTRFSGCSKKASLVALAKVIFGHAFLDSFGLNRAS